MEISYVLKIQTISPSKLTSEILIEKENFILKSYQTSNIFSITEYKNEREQLSQKFKNFFLLDLPDIGKFTMNKNSIAIWLRANSYFVVTKKKYDDVMNTCNNLASITDQTGGWITLNLEGKLTKSLLEKLLTLDLDLLKKENAVRVSINKINCLVLCNKQFENYTIFCPVSFFETMKKRLVNLTNLIA